MYSRSLAWNMLAAANNADTRREQQIFQAHMRSQVGNPLKNIGDNKFLKIYRVSKEAFEYLCKLLRKNTNLKSSQRVSLRSKILCALLFYAHGDYQSVVGEANHFSQEAISVYIDEVTTALNHPDIIKRFITFPTTKQERDAIKLSFYSKYKMPGVIGCIDGSHFKIFPPKKDEEHLYYCRKHYHSLNVQVICDSNCKILSVNAKFGGASHDSFVWQNSQIYKYLEKLHNSQEVVWLLGDSAYPQRPWIMTPYSNPLPGSAEEVYNRKHMATRVLIENAFGILKNRWRCVHRDRTLHYSPEKSAKIIIACCVLHNLALEHEVPEMITSEPQEAIQRNELTSNHDEQNDQLLIGRTLRHQLARRLASS